MSWRLRLGFVLVVALTLVVAGASVACAAGAPAAGSVSVSASVTASPSNSGTSAPLVQGPYSVQIGPNQDPGQPGKVIVILSINLDPSIQLPARVRIPIPPGATVAWAGEVLGGDIGADPQRTYTLHDGAGGAQYAEFTLTQSRRGQVDTIAGPLTIKGTSVSAQLSFVQSVPSTSTEFAVRIPPNVSDVKIDPKPSGAPETNSSGESLYYIGAQTLPIGTNLGMSISYTQGAPSTSKPLASSSSSFLMLLGILLVVLVAFIAFFSRRGSSEDDEEEQDDEFGDDEFADEDDETDLEDDEDGDTGEDDEVEESDAAEDE